MTGFIALLRRELWEHRALLVVPVVLAVLILAGSLYGVIQGTSMVGEVAHSDDVSEMLASPQVRQAVPALYAALAAIFSGVLCVVVLLYLADCLYADRRDRSILFWKSLPVSDAATVLSKLTTALVVAPGASLAIAFITTVGVLMMGTVALWIGGVPGSAALWAPGSLIRAILGVPFAFFLLMLWYAPVAAWFLLASAWAPRAPLLWATLPPIALIVLESVTFQSHYVPNFLAERLGGVYERLFDAREYTGVGVHGDHIEATVPVFRDVVDYLTSLDLWGGLLVAAGFTVLAIALRRYRDDS